MNTEDFKNEIEFKMIFKSNDLELWDNFKKFTDIFLYVFKDINESGKVEGSIITILKRDGEVVNKKNTNSQFN